MGLFCLIAETPTYLLNNFEKHAYKFTLFFPTDKALARYKPKANCAKVPMSNILAQHMVPVMYNAKQLAGLKRGKKVRRKPAHNCTVQEQC